MKKQFLILVLLAMFCVPSFSHAAPYELSLTLSYSERQMVHKWWEAFAEKVKADTNGKVEIIIYPNSTLVKPTEAASAMMKGAVDISFVTSMHQDLAPRLSALTMPFLYKDAQHAGRVFQAALKEPVLQEEIRKIGLPLTGLSAAPNYFGSTTTPIKTMADLKGKRIIVITPQGMDEVKSWGGNPIMIPVTDSYVALQRGMGEAIYAPLNALAAHHELVKYLTIVPAISSVTVFMIREDAMKNMPEEGKKVFAETFTNDYPDVTVLTDGTIADGYEMVEKAQANKTEVIYLDEAVQEEFRKASFDAFKNVFIEKMLYAKLTKEEAEAWYARVLELADTVE